MVKTRPNVGVVAERMRRTQSHRRQLIESSSLKDVLETYPALQNYDLVSIALTALAGLLCIAAHRQPLTTSVHHLIHPMSYIVMQL